MAKRGCESWLNINSCMVWTSVTGTLGSSEDTNWRMVGSRLRGSIEVRTTVYRQHQVGICEAGRYIKGFISRSVADRRMFPTTPTISRQGGPPGTPLPAPGLSFLPIRSEEGRV